MTTERRPDWFLKMRNCEGKVKYDRAGAEQHAMAIRKKEPRRVDKCVAYECPHCKGWHVGHKRADRSDH